MKDIILTETYPFPSLNNPLLPDDIGKALRLCFGEERFVYGLAVSKTDDFEVTVGAGSIYVPDETNLFGCIIQSVVGRAVDVGENAGGDYLTVALVLQVVGTQLGESAATESRLRELPATVSGGVCTLDTPLENTVILASYDKPPASAVLTNFVEYTSSLPSRDVNRPTVPVNAVGDISNPVEGLVAFVTPEARMYVYVGGTWIGTPAFKPNLTIGEFAAGGIAGDIATYNGRTYIWDENNSQWESAYPAIFEAADEFSLPNPSVRGDRGYVPSTKTWFYYDGTSWIKELLKLNLSATEPAGTDGDFYYDLSNAMGRVYANSQWNDMASVTTLARIAVADSSLLPTDLTNVDLGAEWVLQDSGMIVSCILDKDGNKLLVPSAGNLPHYFGDNDTVDCLIDNVRSGGNTTTNLMNGQSVISVEGVNAVNNVQNVDMPFLDGEFTIKFSGMYEFDVQFNNSNTSTVRLALQVNGGLGTALNPYHGEGSNNPRIRQRTFLNAGDTIIPGVHYFTGSGSAPTVNSVSLRVQYLGYF